VALSGAKGSCDRGTLVSESVVDGGYVCQINKVASAGALFGRDNVLVSISAVTSQGQTPAQIQAGFVDLLKSFVATSPSDTTSTSVAASGGISDATVARDKLLAAAPVGSPVDTKDYSIAAWPTPLPGVQFSGNGVPADPKNVSGFTFAGKGTQFLAFAVADTQGRCAERFAGGSLGHETRRQVSAGERQSRQRVLGGHCRHCGWPLAPAPGHCHR
jgi:hypothetical protein